MGWHKTHAEGKVMWEREDGMRVDSTQAIEAIEKAESDALRKSIEHARQRRAEKDWDLDTEHDNEEDGNPFAPFIVLGVVALIYFFHWLLAV